MCREVVGEERKKEASKSQKIAYLSSLRMMKINIKEREKQVSAI